MLAEATDRLNRYQVHRLLDLVLSRLPPRGRVGILGLSYKPNTDVIEESQAVQLAEYLLDRGIPVVLYDPAALDNVRHVLGRGATLASSAEECVRQADVLVLATPWEEFKGLSPSHLNYSNGRPVVIDCWRILDGRQYGPAVEYVVLGRGAHPDDPRQAWPGPIAAHGAATTIPEV
ncbi:MAG: UDP binding domain-containing protein [Chloroflexia bacterium]